MILYCNSDSYGVLANGGRVYGEFLGEHLGAKQIINQGKSGSCNRRIFRTTVRDLIQLRSNNPQEKILAVICLGSLIRNEWWDPLLKVTGTDGHFSSFQIHGLDNRAQPFFRYAEEWYRMYDDEAEQTNLMMDLVMLTTWFEHNNIDYVIFAGNTITYKPIDYADVFIRDFADRVFSNPRILNINEFSFVKYCIDQGHRAFDYDLYQEHGHHSEPAHRDFADFLYNFYKQVTAQ